MKKKYVQQRDFGYASSVSRRCIHQIHSYLNPFADILLENCQWDYHEELNQKCDELNELINKLEKSLSGDVRNVF